MRNRHSPLARGKVLIIISALLTFLGVIFMGVGGIFKVLPMDPMTVNITINGVMQPHTQATVDLFKNLFMAIFCGVGSLLLVSGLAMGLILFLTLRRADRRR